MKLQAQKKLCTVRQLQLSSPCLLQGGIDGHIAQLLSTPEHDMQREVQAAIALHHQGEQPVGTCLILTAHAAFDFLAYAPTMRVPLVVKETFNAYQAFRAVLLSVKDSSHPIETVVCSAFCTGVGHLKPMAAAAQMRLAYDSVFHSPPQADWGHILEFHSRLEATTSLIEPKGRAPAAASILSSCCAQ